MDGLLETIVREKKEACEAHCSPLVSEGSVFTRARSSSVSPGREDSAPERSIWFAFWNIVLMRWVSCSKDKTFRQACLPFSWPFDVSFLFSAGSDAISICTNGRRQIIYITGSIRGMWGELNCFVARGEDCRICVPGTSAVRSQGRQSFIWRHNIYRSLRGRLLPRVCHAVSKNMKSP